MLAAQLGLHMFVHELLKVKCHYINEQVEVCFLPFEIFHIIGGSGTGNYIVTADLELFENEYIRWHGYLFLEITKCQKTGRIYLLSFKNFFYFHYLLG